MAIERTAVGTDLMDVLERVLDKGVSLEVVVERITIGEPERTRVSHIVAAGSFSGPGSSGSSAPVFVNARVERRKRPAGRPNRSRS